jgi:hypothetical protein
LRMNSLDGIWMTGMGAQATHFFAVSLS